MEQANSARRTARCHLPPRPSVAVHGKPKMSLSEDRRTIFENFCCKNTGCQRTSKLKHANTASLTQDHEDRESAETGVDTSTKTDTDAHFEISQSSDPMC